jgi:hypothetical protein
LGTCTLLCTYSAPDSRLLGVSKQKRVTRILLATPNSPSELSCQIAAAGGLHESAYPRHRHEPSRKPTLRRAAFGELIRAASRSGPSQWGKRDPLDGQAGFRWTAGPGHQPKYWQVDVPLPGYLSTGMVRRTGACRGNLGPAGLAEVQGDSAGVRWASA